MYKILISSVCLVFVFTFVLASCPDEEPAETSTNSSTLLYTTTSSSNPDGGSDCPAALDFTMLDIDGVEKHLCDYLGQVILIVNTASLCGYTYQYTGLQDLYETYKDQGFVILGFPANDFGSQEPGTDEEIKQFCTSTYAITFPMFSKISVTGIYQHALYNYLTQNVENAALNGSVQWNFEKFLISKEGLIINRFRSSVEPQSHDIVTAVAAALQE
jgi:glutathione peroxidase